MGRSYKNSSPTFSNFMILHHHITSLEAIQQIQEKCYVTCEKHQSQR